MSSIRDGEISPSSPADSPHPATSKPKARHNDGDSQENTEAVKTKRNFFLFIPKSWILVDSNHAEVEVKNSNISTVFLLLNTMIGSGILVQPYVFKETGLVLVILEYILIAWMIYTAIYVMMGVARKHEIYDYSALTKHVLGPRWCLLGDVSFVVNGAGALLSYIMILGTLFHDVIHTFIDRPCHGFYCDRIFLTIIPIACFTLPLCLVRNFGHLSAISYLSIAVVLASMSLVIIGGPIIESQKYQDRSSVNLWNFGGSIRTIGNIVFSFGFITGSFHSYNAMNDKNVDTFNSLSRTTLYIGVSMCFLTGIFGYLTFLDDVEINILESFEGKLGAFFKLLLILHLILYIPGDFVISRASFWKLFNTDIQTEGNALFVSTTIIAVCLLTLIAILLVEFGNSTVLSEVIDVTGGFAGSIMYFIIPAMIGIKEFPPMDGVSKYNYYSSLILLVVGVYIVMTVMIHF